MTPRLRTDDEEEDGDDDQTDERGYLVNLIGPWSRYISEDLKTTLSLKIYLDAYAPEFDPELRSWEFFNGVRADLIVHDPTLNHHDGPKPFTVFSKRVDLGIYPIVYSDPFRSSASSLFLFLDLHSIVDEFINI